MRNDLLIRTARHSTKEIRVNERNRDFNSIINSPDGILLGFK